MRASSFLPAVTLLARDLNLKYWFDGIVFEYSSQIPDRKQVVVRYVLEGKGYTHD